ncbi:MULTISPECIES: cell division protein FtsL [Acidithiobacillus]|jgi:cell division protein FtsL|uniref:Cell division protein FtsL n=2 Tax=Acidithiobacillus ferrooxidans TaxID=920 RepID=B7J3V9_ACIF2|nr:MULTISPECIES: cell division protein FtsL [Acidithiobacillus]MCL5955948.1 cell division protein FtsL [Gammaproteobacteria bacterium]ACH82646.1 cell division protein FtsL [Acidithiobacillus ferrooxidans ATCC 53993]ACK78085.1 cell division protein FtsL [Acidithiobacillus ferrooxidans ATCC 23270]MBN6746139.1 cell division protein FtsL [Acidithiobacillus sp. MC2.2]MBN6749170.1 cell division protein FtsL [Acidithiobacillus sp. PG05]
MRRSTILLALLITASLFGIVAARQNTRSQFIALQEAQAKHFALDNRWGQLELEQATLASNARVGDIARQKLGLSAPKSNQIIMVRTR